MAGGRLTRSGARRSGRAPRPCGPGRTRRRCRSPRRSRTTSRPRRRDLGGPLQERVTVHEAPKPSAMPIAPPASDSTIASTRNCSSTSTVARADRQAQADLARPLGHRHQHDVHDADAADEQRHRGDARQQVGHRRRGRRQHARHLLERPHHEVVVVAGLDAGGACAAASAICCGHRVERHAVLGRDRDAGDVLHAEQLLLHGRVGDDDGVVLVLPHRRLPLAGEHADDLERLVLDADDRAGRIGAGAEQLIAHRPSRAPRPCAARRHVAVGEEAAELHRPRADLRRARRSVPWTCVFQLALDATICARVLSPGDRYRTPRHLLADRLGIVRGQRRAPRPAPDGRARRRRSRR